MDFFDSPFGSFGNGGRSRGGNHRRGGYGDYRVEEVEDINGGAPNQDEEFGNPETNPPHSRASPVDNIDEGTGAHSSVSSTPRVDEPENDYGERRGGRRRNTSHRSNPSSFLAFNPFSDDDDFFGGFGGMFGGIQRHMDRMRQDFSSAFDEIGRISSDTGGDGNSRVYCSSTSETIMPNGVREVKHTSRDSATGKQTSYRARQIGDKKIVEHSSKDLRSGVEQRERNMMNVNDGEMDDFDRMWSQYGLSGGSSMRSLK